jgi:hypothetical protein
MHRFVTFVAASVFSASKSGVERLYVEGDQNLALGELNVLHLLDEFLGVLDEQSSF